MVSAYFHNAICVWVDKAGSAHHSLCVGINNRLNESVAKRQHFSHRITEVFANHADWVDVSNGLVFYASPAQARKVCIGHGF